MMRVQRYPIETATLHRIAAFIWHLTSDTGMDHCKLLPVLNTDLIINLSELIFYCNSGEEEQQAPTVHIRYGKTKPQLIRQEAPIDVWGVSLYPQGVYPLLRTDMTGMDGQVVDVKGVCPDFVRTVTTPNENQPQQIEQALIQWLGDDSDENLRILEDFFEQLPSVRIGEYCRQNDIGIKKLERLVKKYTGLTPKAFQQIARFQTAGNQMLYGTSSPSLADLAYFHNYSDQMHLTKEFKSYTGTTPSTFLHSHDSVKEKLFHED